MEFKQIEAFVNVIKYKSFSKAADASFLTQPTISTHISVRWKKSWALR
ncbi:MAG: LysR family transcriptional regulator [Emergencia sp.]|nr:LysR family transcriptional regulator [Emergencia sp.]